MSNQKKETPVKPLNPEQKAFQQQSEALEGHDPNRLENPHLTAMSIDQANKIVNEKYKDFEGTEAPPDLAQARAILKNVNPPEEAETKETKTEEKTPKGKSGKSEK